MVSRVGQDKLHQLQFCQRLALCSVRKSRKEERGKEEGREGEERFTTAHR